MEGRKRLSAATVAAWCLLAVLLLSGQLQPAAAMSDEFCRCYKACYAECRKDSGPYPCNFGCLQDCFNDDQLPRPARPISAADCDRVCLIRVCGVMSTDAAVAVAGGGDDQTCLVDCRNSIGHSAPLKDAN